MLFQKSDLQQLTNLTKFVSCGLSFVQGRGIIKLLTIKIAAGVIVGFGIVEICHLVSGHTFNKYGYILHYLNGKVSLDFYPMDHYLLFFSYVF